jgi:hypothetical protein
VAGADAVGELDLGALGAGRHEQDDTAPAVDVDDRGVGGGVAS